MVCVVVLNANEYGLIRGLWVVWSSRGRQVLGVFPDAARAFAALEVFTDPASFMYVGSKDLSRNDAWHVPKRLRRLIPRLARDAAVDYIRNWSREYYGGRETEPTVVDGISFWRVGRNSSHQFCAGVDAQGRLYQKSVGEKIQSIEEMERGDSPGLETYITEVRNFSDGYYGHY